jgi:very-short-patch-repair endonuclease
MGKNKANYFKKTRKISPSSFGGIVVPRVIGEVSIFAHRKPSKSNIRRFAKEMQKKPTKAEIEFKSFLLRLNSGVLRGKFKTQHVASGRWIIDFFFPEIRLGVEIDGAVHNSPKQRKLDRQKERDCAKIDITLLRITNAEVFGGKVKLTEKLRHGWRMALDRENRIIGTSPE